jgi:hypothetical protein
VAEDLERKQMRNLIIMAMLVLATACTSKTAVENKDHVTKFGLITEKEEVDMDQVKKESKTNTNVYASVNSGGGVSIGIGFLVGMLGSDEPEENPVRYEINLIDGGEITIYHMSRLFEVDDCVAITLHEDEKENPPSMERSKDSC